MFARHIIRRSTASGLMGQAKGMTQNLKMPKLPGFKGGDGQRKKLLTPEQKSWMFSQEGLMYFIGGNIFIQLAIDGGLFRDPKSGIFDFRYRTNATGAPLAEFYEAHDLLEVMMPIPRLFKTVLDNVHWDADPPSGIVASAMKGPMVAEEENRCYAKYVGMDVGFEIINEESEEQEDEIEFFCRHERFILYVPILEQVFGMKTRLFDWTMRFQFRLLKDEEKNSPDERYEISHFCTKFKGFWMLRYAIMTHSKYTTWGCKYVVNSPVFVRDEDADDLEELEHEHHRRMRCAPLHWMSGGRMSL